MMTYKLDFDFENYLNLDIDISALKKSVGKAMGRDAFKRYWLDNTSLKEHWLDIGAKWVEIGLKKAAPDITVWNGPHLIMNDRACRVLEPHLGAYGEFMPLTVESTLHQLFYCTRMVAVDEENSRAKLVDGVWLGVEVINFSQSTEIRNLMFKTEFDRCRGLYCGESFREICLRNDLKGLIFQPGQE